MAASVHPAAPSHDVFRNVLLALQPDSLLEIVELWVGDLEGRQVAIDGKVSRGTKDSATGKSSLHILRAWVSEASLSVCYEVCLDKSNELEALPRPLVQLQFHGAIPGPLCEIKLLGDKGSQPVILADLLYK